MDGTRNVVGRASGGNPSAHTRTQSQRTVLGMRGTLGEGRRAVAYAYCERHAHVNIAPANAYTREPMTARERAIVRFAPRMSEGTGPLRVREYDPWNGTRRILPNAPYVGGEAWRADQRERVRNAPTGHAHTCASERREVTRKCTCAAYGGAPHAHRTDDGIAHSQAPRITYADVLARINAREHLTT